MTGGHTMPLTCAMWSSSERCLKTKWQLLAEHDHISKGLSFWSL